MLRWRSVFYLLLSFVTLPISWAAHFSQWKPEALVLVVRGDPDAKETASPFILSEKTPAEAAALLRAIDTHYEDDTPRLVYADWLQEHGDEAAARFIRLQCAVARIPRPKEYRAMLNEADELLKLHRITWFGGLQKQVSDFKTHDDVGPYSELHLTLRRGFPWGIRLEFSGNGRARKPFPTRDDHRAVLNRAIATLAAPTKPRFQGLEIPESHSIEDYLGSSWLEEITALKLPLRYSGDADRSLGDPRLRELAKKKLRDLSLALNTSPPGEAGAALRAREYRNLKSLAVGALQVHPDGNAFVRELFYDETIRGIDWELEELSIRAHLDFVGAELLAAAAPRLPNLLALNLTDNKIDDTGVRALARAKWLALRQLDLSANPFKASGVNAIASSLLAKQLHYLDLHDQPSIAPGGYGRVSEGTTPSRDGMGCDALVESIAALYF